MTDGIRGILLAAGQSTRFGSNKLLHVLDNGLPMAVASARNLCAVLNDCIAVVEDADDEVARLLAVEGLRLVQNPRTLEGMGTSIAAGVQASSDAGGWVIALADMPFIQPDTIRRVVKRLEEGADLVAPVFHEHRGHPVGFAARHGPALQSLRGDEGARWILASNHKKLRTVPVDDAGVARDIDYP